MSCPSIPGWIVQTKSYVPAAGVVNSSVSDLPGMISVAVFALIPCLKARLCGCEVDLFSKTSLTLVLAVVSTCAGTNFRAASVSVPIVIVVSPLVGLSDVAVDVSLVVVATAVEDVSLAVVVTAVDVSLAVVAGASLAVVATAVAGASVAGASLAVVATAVVGVSLMFVSIAVVDVPVVVFPVAVAPPHAVNARAPMSAQLARNPRRFIFPCPLIDRVRTCPGCTNCQFQHTTIFDLVEPNTGLEMRLRDSLPTVNVTGLWTLLYQ